MTVAHWVAAREPVPPASLAARLQALLPEDARTTGASAAPPMLVEAAAAVIERLLQEGATTRASALDLLVADALATYACEAQADDPAALDARCTWAMRHLSMIANAA